MSHPEISRPISKPMSIPIGIDAISFSTSPFMVSLKDLARARQVEDDKYTLGLGVHQMAVTPPDQDTLTYGVNAASQVLHSCTPSQIAQIHTVLFATESGIDQSKAAGIYLHQLLKLPRRCRVVELKQACYGGTMALQMAKALVHQNPTESVLIIMSDVARYGLSTLGESSQGGGAIALMISANPRILALSDASGYVTEDVMDFWRPNYRDEALVDGKYSIDVYLRVLKECWQDYSQLSQLGFSDHQAFLFHTPIPRLAEKAYQKLRLTAGIAKTDPDPLAENLERALRYSRIIGNCYTASLYIGLCSLLDHAQDLTDQRIGFYSYGSGCSGELFSGMIQPGYQTALHRETHTQLLKARTLIDITTYEHYYQFPYRTDGSHQVLPKTQTSGCRLAEIRDHQRIYEMV